MEVDHSKSIGLDGSFKIVFFLIYIYIYKEKYIVLALFWGKHTCEMKKWLKRMVEVFCTRNRNFNKSNSIQIELKFIIDREFSSAKKKRMMNSPTTFSPFCSYHAREVVQNQIVIDCNCCLSKDREGNFG